MPTQTTYSLNIAPPPPGTIAGAHDVAKTTTGICETASPGIPFGRIVSRGTLSDQGAVLGAVSPTDNTRVLGVSVKDATLRGDLAVLDAFLPPNSMTILEEGDIWVEPGEAVLAFDPVFFQFTTGILFKATGGGKSLTALQGCYFKTACGIGGRAIVSMAFGKKP